MDKDTCIYCDSGVELTWDHVPPKGIFPKPRPADLITVPACLACNASFQKDDEYFRTTLGIREEVDESTELRLLSESVQRDLRRPQKSALADWIARGSHTAVLYGPTGEVVFKKRLFKLDEGRIKAVVKRTVRGLYWHETSRRLPTATDFRVYSFREIDGLPHSDRLGVLGLLSIVALENPVSAAGGQFIWRAVCEPPGEVPDGAYITEFYGRIGYFTLYRAKR